MEASMELSKERENDMIVLKNGKHQYDKDYSGPFVSIEILRSLQKKVSYLPEEINRDEYLGSYS